MRRLERAAALPDDVLLARAETVSRWSVAEQLFHVALANGLCFENALALGRGKGLRVKDFESVDPEARPMLARGTIPRGSAEAPRFVRPPEDVDVGVLREVLAQGRAALDEVRAELDAVAAAPRCIRHQVLGDFDAAEWLRFARVHTVHHLTLARDVERALRERAAGV